MSGSNATVGELLKAKTVTDNQVNAAVDAYLADPCITTHAIADGYSLDLKGAVRGQDWVLKIARDPAATSRLKRGAIRTAILLARAQKA